MLSRVPPPLLADLQTLRLAMWPPLLMAASESPFLGKIGLSAVFCESASYTTSEGHRQHTDMKFSLCHLQVLGIVEVDGVGSASI